MPEKEKQRPPTSGTWKAGNPPPKSEGRPKRPPEPVLDPALPIDLALYRAAVSWTDSNYMPKDGRVAALIREMRKSPTRFNTRWRKLEDDWKKNGGAPMMASAATTTPTPSVKEAADRVEDKVTERVVEDLKEWLERHEREAVG